MRKFNDAETRDALEIAVNDCLTVGRVWDREDKHVKAAAALQALLDEKGGVSAEEETEEILKDQGLNNLVVIAAYGVEHSLRFLEKSNTKHPVLVVRTDLPKEKTRGFGVDYTPYIGFDTGAYLWAYWNHPADKYLFVQDSLVPQTDDYADIFFDKLEENDVVALAGFPFPMWDGPVQELASRYAMGPATPARGIFGPNFAITRQALDKLAEERYLPMPPLHKENAQGKEREWAIAFEAAGLKVHYLHDWHVWISDLYPFTKIYGGRA